MPFPVWPASRDCQPSFCPETASSGLTTKWGDDMMHITGCFVLLGILAQAVSAQTGSVADVNSIVDRMVAALQENRAHLRAFTVKRQYQLLDKQSQPKAEVVADITYRPPGQNQYHIERSTGGMGEKVLRDILTKDTETTTSTRRRDLSHD